LILIFLSCREYGTEKAALKAIISTIPVIFQHADKAVRAEGTNLVMELYRWIGNSVEPFLEALKPVQLKELKEQFSKIIQEDKAPKRYLRSQKKNMCAPPVDAPHNPRKESSSENTIHAPKAKSFDAYDLAEPENILDKLPPQFDELIASSKWSERKEALDALNSLLTAPKLADGHYGSLVQTLLKVFQDFVMFGF
jgi:cytoskeleton-associated protein 5